MYPKMNHEEMEKYNEEMIREVINKFDWGEKLKTILKDRWVSEEPPPHKDDF